jgi:hypothetical protein
LLVRRPRRHCGQWRRMGHRVVIKQSTSAESKYFSLFNVVFPSLPRVPLVKLWHANSKPRKTNCLVGHTPGGNVSGKKLGGDKRL